MNTLLTDFTDQMRFLQRSCDKNHPLHSKASIDPKFQAANVSPIVARGGGAREITVNEIAAPVSVTGILGGNVELLLALEAPVE